MAHPQDLPLPEVVIQLLRQRYPLHPDDELSLTFDAKYPDLTLKLENPRHRYSFRVAHRSGAPAEDPWQLTLDAADALFGQFLESGRDYRNLPSGPDLAFQNARFFVEVSHVMPEMERLADQLLKTQSAS